MPELPEVETTVRGLARYLDGERLAMSVPDDRQSVSGRAALLTNAAPSGALLGPAGSADDRMSVWSSDGEPLFFHRGRYR